MKITTTQLKQIISEEIKKVRLTEQVGTEPGSVELQTLLDVICEGWKSQFNPDVHKGNPRRGLDARSSWDEQCEYACKSLGEKIEELIMETGYSVHRGEWK